MTVNPVPFRYNHPSEHFTDATASESTSGEQKQKVESFMHRIAATAGALIVGAVLFASSDS